MSTYTDWAQIAESSKLLRGTYGKMAQYLTNTDRTTNHCVFGKITTRPQQQVSHIIDELGADVYTYVITFGDAYHAAQYVAINTFTNAWRINHTPAIRRPRVIGLDPDAIKRVYIDVNGSTIDSVEKQHMATMRNYFKIRDNTYLPLMCYRHFAPLAFYGNSRMIIESTKLSTDVAVEVEYALVLPEQLGPEQLMERYKRRLQRHLERFIAPTEQNANFVPGHDEQNANFVPGHNSATCWECCAQPPNVDPNNLDTPTFDETIVYYYPQIKTHLFNDGHEFEIRGTPTLTILTDETENSTIKIVPTVLRDNPMCPKMVFASTRPGVYELYPFDNDDPDKSLRKLNENYILGRGDYTCDKPIVCRIVANYMLTSCGCSVLRYI